MGLLNFSPAARLVASVLVAGWACLAANVLTAQEESVEPVSKLDFYRDVKPILTSHCLECHGEKQAKGEFRIDDRETVISYVTAGDLESSSLWSDYLTSTDPEMRMPPVKHGNPLNAIELATLRVWILDGAEWPEAAPVVAEEPLSTVVVPPAPQRSLFGKAFTFSGYFHPAIVHFPIALLLVSALFVLLSFISRATFEPAAFHLLWMGTLGAIAASVLGWSFADIRGYGSFWNTSWNDDAIARHRIMGVVLSAVAIALTFVAISVRRRDRLGLRVTWLLGSAVLALLVSITGHQGGELTYGEDLYGRAYRKSFGLPESISPAPSESASPATAKSQTQKAAVQEPAKSPAVAEASQPANVKP